MLNPLGVSVVIPMYNAEKYIAECLTSLLAQTFQNFEVVIVDDCSTDSSCALVEEVYAEKFGGRLTLSHTEKNSGSGAVPRNKGLALSRGEYIFFLDADDLLTPTALEELYTLAKNFDADVVYCEKYYELDSAGKNIKEISEQPGKVFVNEPTLDTENLSERVKDIFKGMYWVTPWCKLVRRKLMIEHEIFFPHCKISEDDIWTYGLVFYAKKFLRVPNMVYIYRGVDESVVRKKKTLEENLNFWLSPMILGLKTLENFMSKIEFFQENPRYRYAVLEMFLSRCLLLTSGSWQMSPFEIYEAIKKEFGKNLGEHDVLTAALCAHAITLNATNFVMKQKLLELSVQNPNQEQLTKLQNKIDKKN